MNQNQKDENKATALRLLLSIYQTRAIFFELYGCDFPNGDAFLKEVIDGITQAFDSARDLLCEMIQEEEQYKNKE